MASTTTQWILELVDKITGPMKGVFDSANKAARGVEDIGKEADESAKKLKDMSAIDLFAIQSSINQMADGLRNALQPGIAFEAQMKEVEAITGVTGDALKTLGNNARNTAKQFGGDASAMLESYKGILSRLGPDIADDTDALNTMGINIATLSKTMGNDAPAAMDALTTSMLQFGVNLDNPKEAAAAMTSMMNVLAAGAKEGAAEVPQISEALRVSGVQAKNANVSFIETNSALQALAQGGKYGSEAGIALRNVLGKMAGEDVLPKEAIEKIQALGINYSIVSDKTLPLTTRLRELQKATGDATLIAQMFGTENAAAANILIRSADQQDEYTSKITGTSVATEQADIIMSGFGERMGRVSAWFKDLGISFSGIGKYALPMVSGVAGVVTVMANLSNAQKGVSMLFGALKTMPSIGAIVGSGFTMMSAAAKTFSAVIMNIPVIGWVIAIVAALTALVVHFYNTSETFRGIVWGVVSSVKAAFLGVWEYIKTIATGIWNLIKAVFNPKNWLNPGKMKDEVSAAMSSIADAGKIYGEKVGKAYAEGREKGVEDFRKKKVAKGQPEDSLDINANVTPQLNPADLMKPQPTVGGPVASTAGSVMGGSKSSSGGIKSISQKIDIKNYFSVSKDTDIEGIAEKVVSAISGRLRDAIVVVS